MAGWNHDGVFKEKLCAVCGESFKPKSGVHKFCSELCKGKWAYLSGRVTTQSQYELISGNWRRYLSRLQYVAGRKRNNLTVEELLRKLEEQNYRCAISGLELTCNLAVGKKFPHNVSIDRIIPGGPYSYDNIQLVCRSLNSWRADTELEDFILMCKAVAEYQSKRESEAKNGYEKS